MFRCFVSACTAHIRLACVMCDKDDSWILLFSFSMSSIQMVSKKYVQITITTHTESNLNVNLHASILFDMLLHFDFFMSVCVRRLLWITVVYFGKCFHPVPRLQKYESTLTASVAFENKLFPCLRNVVVIFGAQELLCTRYP